MSQKLKIAVVTGIFPSVSQTFVVNQINALIDMGHDVKLFAYRKGTSKTLHPDLQIHNLLTSVSYFKKPDSSLFKRYYSLFLWTFSNITTISWPLYFKSLNVFEYGKRALSLRLFYLSQHFLTKQSFDIIHVHFGLNAYGVSQLKAMGFIPEKTKLVVSFHGYDVLHKRDKYYKNYAKIITQESSYFTVNSPYLKERLMEFFPNPPKVEVIPMGVDTTYFKRSNENKESDYFTLLFCGRLISLKGPDTAIKVTEQLVNKGYKQFRLRLVGEGPLESSLRTTIKENNLMSYVELKGALNQEDLRDEMELADAFILPGIPDPNTGQQEAQGLVLQEAQAMELPVIVSDVGGMKYGLIDGETGFVVAENSLDGYVYVLENLLKNPKLKRAMGQKGRIFVKEHFETSILIQKLENIFFSL